MKKNVSVIITDLDNTLFDWFDIWYKSFNAMLSLLVNKSGIPQDKLEEEFHECPPETWHFGIRVFSGRAPVSPKKAP